MTDPGKPGMIALTADTITDKQIEELNDCRDPSYPPLTIRERAACVAALRVPNVFRLRISKDEIRRSRAICAGVINVRRTCSAP